MKNVVEAFFCGAAWTLGTFFVAQYFVDLSIPIVIKTETTSSAIVIDN